jgi:hypothetical protein
VCREGREHTTRLRMERERKAQLKREEAAAVAAAKEEDRERVERLVAFIKERIAKSPITGADRAFVSSQSILEAFLESAGELHLLGNERVKSLIFMTIKVEMLKIPGVFDSRYSDKNSSGCQVQVAGYKPVCLLPRP